jgi:hypothetical protein
MKKKLASLLRHAEGSGQSEALLLAEFVRDLLEDNPDNYRLLASSMDELITWAQAFQHAAGTR